MLSQLLIQYETVLDMLENGEIVDVIYLDFVKAFNKVDITIWIFFKLQQSESQENSKDG